MSPGQVLEGVSRRLRRRTTNWWKRRRDLQGPAKSSRACPHVAYQYFPPLVQDIPTIDHLTAHRFDLLGSGWTRVHYGMRCRGLEGRRFDMPAAVGRIDADGRWLERLLLPRHIEQAQRVWRLVPAGYQPIDWQIDFKSGYRWDARTWYRDIRFGHIPGPDIKVPWELARCQNLPQLALAYRPDQSKTASYLQQFIGQILDFIAANPPRMGVNWQCTMEVAIRASNWLVALDIFRAKGAPLPQDFVEELNRSVYEHGQHIVSNLEWSPVDRQNHYLGNVVGLLFVASYLNRTHQTDAWLAFALRQLIAEVERQFGADGTNFESSTSYHRFSAEMVIYATVLVLALGPEKRAALKTYDHRPFINQPGLEPAPIPMYPRPGNQDESPFTPWYFERLEKAAEFTLHVTKPSGHIHQIGDNDNGRFLKLQPIYRRMTAGQAKAQYANLRGYEELPEESAHWDEDHLDHRCLVGAINGLLDREDFSRFHEGVQIDYDMVHTLAGKTGLPSCNPAGQPVQSATVRITSIATPNEFIRKCDSQPQLHQYQSRIHLSDSKTVENLVCYAYPDFGLFLWRCGRMYLAVRCGTRGPDDSGCHAHNDQLAVELNVGGQDWIADPGSYLYTPDANRRNAYRSVKAHFAPQTPVDREPGRLDLGVFRLPDRARARAECLYFGREGFVGQHSGFGVRIVRVMQIKPESILITDYVDRQLGLQEIPAVTYSRPFSSSVEPSIGYGIVRNS